MQDVGFEFCVGLPSKNAKNLRCSEMLSLEVNGLSPLLFMDNQFEIRLF